MPPAPAPAGGEAPGAGARPPTGVETSTVAGFGERDRRSALAPFFTSALVFGVRSAGWETSGLTTSIGALERGAADAVTLAGGGGWCRPVVVEPEVEVLCPARAFVEPGLSGSGVFTAAPGAGVGANWGWAPTPTVWPLVGTGCAAVTGTGSGWGAPAAAPEPLEAADALGCAWTAVRTWLAIALPSAAAGTAAEALLGTAAAAAAGTAAAGLCGMAAATPAGTALWTVGITDESSADAGPAAIRSAPIDASMPTSPRSFGNFEIAISNFLSG
jgi:hypothetical protein